MIQGRRVTLRPWRLDDLPVLRRWHDEYLYGLLARELNARYQPERVGWGVSGDLA